jgi:hypothetical protein
MNQILPFLILLVFASVGPQHSVHKKMNEANDSAQDYSGSHVSGESDPGNLLYASDQTRLSFTIPLKRAGKLILMEAVIDSISGNIILDTGSTSLVLNSIYFRQGRQQRGLVAGGITGSAGAFSRSQFENVNISGIQFQHLEANITDLGHIEAARNIRVLGFVGLSIFSEFEVVIDLQSNVMELHRLDRRGNRLAETGKRQNHDMEIPVKIESHIVFLDGIINGRKLTFCLDTGAESNVLSIHLPNRVLNTVSILRRASLRGAGAQQVEVLYGTMNDFSIDRQNFEDMNTIVTNLNAMNHAYGTNIDGMLGCDFLERGIFYINLTKRTLGINLIKEERK